MSTLNLALDAQGTMVSALTAPKRAKYTCLECGGMLLVKRGEQRAAHFAHDASHPGGCSGESVTHLAAKRLLRSQLEAELAQGRSVRWAQHCPGPAAEQICRMQAVLQQSYEVQGTWTVQEEVTHDRYRFDVAVVVGNRAVFGFEVFHRHQVPDEKAAGLGVPWLELVAEDILEFKPRVPFRGSYSVRRCPDCERLSGTLRERQLRDAQRGEQSRKFSAEVEQVQRTWADILNSARGLDRRQRGR